MLNKYTIKQILKETWEDFVFKNINLIPHYIFTVINKMLSCRDPHILGYHKYACPEHPDQFVIVPNSCKSSFCNSCGKVLTDKFVAKIEANFPRTSFRHICFTIPDSLRELLDKNKHLLNCLFMASSQTVLSFCKEKPLLPLIISALHTYGRDIKFNPHIHLLVSCGGLLIKKDGSVGKKWKKHSFFPYVMLHKRYKVLLVNILKKTILKYLQDHIEFSGLSCPFSLNNFFDHLLEINWYVHSSKELPSDKFTTTYICRYAKRPPIAESRILFYGKLPDNKNTVFVTFCYKPRQDKEIIRTVHDRRIHSFTYPAYTPSWFPSGSLTVVSYQIE